MKKKAVMFSTVFLLVSIASTGAQASGEYAALKNDPYVMEGNLDSSLLPLPEDKGKQASNVKVVQDFTYQGKVNHLNGKPAPEVSTTAIPAPDPDYTPYLYTNVTWSGTHRVEWVISNGKFIFMHRPDVYYYTQNTTVTGFDAYTGKVMSTAANATGTYLTFQVASYSKMARWFDWLNGMGKPFNYGDWVLGAASWEIQQNVPLFGKISTAPVPYAGTQSVIIYQSDSGASNSWRDRFRFDIDPYGKVSITTWQVS